MFDLMFCAEALFVIFTPQYGADKGSVEVQGISRKISKNHIFFRLAGFTQWKRKCGKRVEILCGNIGTRDWYLQSTACAIFAQEK